MVTRPGVRRQTENRTIRLTFSFDLDKSFLDGLSDFDLRRSAGITTASVAAAVVRHHDARDGYIGWQIER